MTFYQTWQETRKMNIDDRAFIVEFLKASQISREVFLNGSVEDNLHAIDFLESVNIDDIIGAIKEMGISELKASDVIQFSNYEHGVIGLGNVLIGNETESTFDEIGYRLISAKTELAKKKYGENHSKLALECDFVYLRKQGAYYVGLTNLGRVINNYDKKIILNVASKLLARNKFIISMIHQLDDCYLLQFHMFFLYSDFSNPYLISPFTKRYYLTIHNNYFCIKFH